jgi:hypothetical protein
VLNLAPNFSLGIGKTKEKPGSSSTAEKEQMFHEPQIEKLIRIRIMAKARILFEIVFTSLKAGANFEKNCRMYGENSERVKSE